MFAAILTTVRGAIHFISYGLLAMASIFAVTGLIFSFVNGANEIMASIGCFAIAFPAFIVGGYLQLLVAALSRSRPRYDSALIDDNEGVYGPSKTAPRSTRPRLTRETFSCLGGSTVAIDPLSGATTSLLTRTACSLASARRLL